MAAIADATLILLGALRADIIFSASDFSWATGIFCAKAPIF